MQRGWTWSFGVRAALIYVACLPFWTYPLGFGTPFYGALRNATFWLHERGFAAVGFDLSRFANLEVASKVEMALAGALLWLLLDRRRAHEAELGEILLLTTRYVLGGVLVGIGLIKVFPIQMWAPSPIQLIQPLGQPEEIWPAWGLTVKAMGVATSYQMYTGWLEVVAGALLFFRRTTTLGTLLAVAQFTAIIAMTSDTADFANAANFNWIAGGQVPAVMILAAAAWRPAMDLFVLNRPTDGVASGSRSPWLRRLELGLGVFFAAALLHCLYRTVLTWQDRQLHSPITGVYQVEQFTRGGESPLAGLDAARRWRKVAIRDCSRMAVRTIDDTPLEFAITFPASTGSPFRDCAAATSATTGKLTLAGSRAGSAGVARYVRQGPDRLQLEAELDGEKIAAHLTRLANGHFPLLRGEGP